jgi:hypothetical protein
MAATHVSFLSEAEWQSYGVRLLVFTRYWARTHYGWLPDQTLPTGRSPEDIVIEVLLSFQERARTLTPGIPVYVQLKSAVRSMLWNLHQLQDSKRVVACDPEDLRAYRDPALTPKETTQRDDFWRTFFDYLESDPVVTKRPELYRLVVAFEDGATSITELGQALQLPPDKISELKRQLRPIAEKILAKLRKEGDARENHPQQSSSALA